MTAETIATFTRKIAASNRTGLVCVLYEIYFAYETEALDFLEEQKNRRCHRLYKGSASVWAGGTALERST